MSGAANALAFSDVWDFHHGDVGVGWGLVMMLIMVLFWGLVIYGVVALVRGGLREGGPGRDDPGEILKRRLAHGEITVEEYEQRKALLERDTATGSGPSAPAAGTGWRTR